MKAIINGKRFDTEKATLVGSSCSNEGRGDFRYWQAGLYKTPRSGVFFLAGRGGPMTIFSHSIGNNGYSGGEKIIPMSREDALEWASAELDTSTVEEHFASVIEDA